MIFVTVGTDLPFDRLVRTVDRWAAERKRNDVFAQVGMDAWKPTFIPYAEFLEPAEFTRRFVEADLIVAHAGMGTILSALRYGKPVIVMPRRASLGEQRNEHQLATAKHLLNSDKVNVAYDEDELYGKLDEADHMEAKAKIGPYADEKLQASIRTFIWEAAKLPPEDGKQV